MRALLLGAVVIATLTLASTAAAFDRDPIRVSGLRPDGWGNSISNAASDVRRRWGATGQTYCVGVIMIGSESRSSWVRGTTRYWDKLACVADNGNDYVSFIYDAKGKGAEAFTIYRLKHHRK